MRQSSSQARVYLNRKKLAAFSARPRYLLPWYCVQTLLWRVLNISPCILFPLIRIGLVPAFKNRASAFLAPANRSLLPSFIISPIYPLFRFDDSSWFWGIFIETGRSWHSSFVSVRQTLDTHLLPTFVSTHATICHSTALVTKTPNSFAQPQPQPRPSCEDVYIRTHIYTTVCSPKKPTTDKYSARFHTNTQTRQHKAPT